MTLSILLLLLLVFYALLEAGFYFWCDPNKKVAKGFLVAAIILAVAIIFLAIFLMITYKLFYVIIVLLQGASLLLNIKTLKKFLNN